MQDLFRQFKYLLLAIALILLACHLAFTSLKKKEQVGYVGSLVMRAYAPVHRVIAWPFFQVARTLNDYFFLVDLKKENEALAKQNETLRLRTQQFSEMEAENARFRKLLDFQPPMRMKPIYARVLARAAASESLSLLIDKGTKQGVDKNMIAMTPEGLLGHVNTATTNSARVLPLTDVASVIDAVVQRSRASGLLKGKGKRVCHLEFLNRSDDVAQGDVVVSSGIGGIFPAGLVIGVVSRIAPDSTDMFLDIEVTPLASFENVEEILIFPGVPPPPVIVEEPPAPTPGPETPTPSATPASAPMSQASPSEGAAAPFSVDPERD